MRKSLIFWRLRVWIKDGVWSFHFHTGNIWGGLIGSRVMSGVPLSYGQYMRTYLKLVGPDTNKEPSLFLKGDANVTLWTRIPHLWWVVVLQLCCHLLFCSIFFFFCLEGAHLELVWLIISCLCVLSFICSCVFHFMKKGVM